MLNLAGYQETKQIYIGTRTLVYQAVRLHDNQDVIIKILRNTHPSFNEIIKFRNQYIITRNLNHPSLVKPLAIERYNNGYALVMSDEGDISFSDYWQQSKFSLKNFLDIAIQLA